MKHVLLPHHREHLKGLGIPEPPKEIEMSNEEYRQHYADWKRTLPEAPHEELHTHVIGHAAWKRHTQTAEPEESQTEPVIVEHRHRLNWGQILLIILTLLAILFLARGKAHAQFSKVNYVQFTNSGASTISFFTAPFTIQCLSSMTCTPITGGISIAAAAGGTGCTLQGGTNLLLYDTSTACNDITKWSTNGTTTITAAATAIFDLSAAATFKVPTSAGCAPTVNAVACYDSTAHLWVFGSNGATVDLCPTAGGTAGQVFESTGGTSCGGYADPIVSGPDAPGAASTKNPVQVAGNDGTDVRAIATDSSGNTEVVGAGTAGSASGGVVTVQGVASMTKLLVTPDSVALPSHQSVNVDEIGGSALAIGQQLAAASIPVILPSATITTLTPPTPPTAAAIGTSVSGDLLIGTQAAASSVPVALPSATITTLTPPTAAAVAAAIVANPPSVVVTQGTGSNLHTVCDSGCGSGGSTTPSDAFANPTTAGLSFSFMAGWNGSTWDRLQVDGSKFLKVNVAAALPAGTNVIGHVIADSGSTTAVTGSVAVTNAGTFAVQDSTLEGAITSSVVQSNTKQINGVTPLMGNGVSGTGSQRVNIASDNSAVPAAGQGATSSAVPSGAIYTGGNGSGNLTGQIMCDKSIIENGITASTQLVAASGSTKVYVCGFYVNGASSTLNTVKLIYGTGSVCASSPSDFSLAVPIQAPTSVSPAGSNITYSSNTVKATPASQALCVSLSAAQSVNVEVDYTQF